MILAIKHKASYYKRFHLDIWGAIKSLSIYKKIDKSSGQYKEAVAILKAKGIKTAEQLYKVKDKELLTLLGDQVNLGLVDERGSIRRSAFRSTLIPWERSSRKISALLDFFYNAYLKRQEFRRRKRKIYNYRLDIIYREPRRKKLKYRFVSLRLVKLFYLTYTYRQFRKIASIMSRKAGCFEFNYILALEGRLISFVYRTSFLSTPFECIQIVRAAHVAVNFIYQRYVNFPVKMQELVTFSDLGKRLIYLNLMQKLSKKAILFNPPRYLFVSYFFFYAYIKKGARQRDLVFPIAVDIYRATGYAF